MEKPVLIKSDAYPGISQTMKLKNESWQVAQSFMSQVNVVQKHCS